MRGDTGIPDYEVCRFDAIAETIMLIPYYAKSLQLTNIFLLVGFIKLQVLGLAKICSDLTKSFTW